MNVGSLALVVADLSGKFPDTIGKTVRITAPLAWCLSADYPRPIFCYEAVFESDEERDDILFQPAELMPLDPPPTFAEEETVKMPIGPTQDVKSVSEWVESIP